MDYNKIYNEIINKRINEFPAGYYEVHHIIPVSLGGTDDEGNLVKLTAKEHFMCHFLLVKIHKGNTESYIKMIKAFMMMCSCQNELQQRYMTSNRYSKLREDFSKYQSDKMSGDGNPQFGKKWYTNLQSNESKRFLPENAPTGWVTGRNKIIKASSRCGVEIITSNSVNARKICDECLRKDPLPKVKVPKSKSKLRVLLVAKEIICENCGVTFTAKGERKLCSLRCVRKYAANQHKVSIQDDVGNIFGSLTDAAKFHGVTVEAIRYRIKTKKYKII